MKVYLRIKNPGPILQVRAKIFLKLPNGDKYGPLLDMKTTLPAAFDSGDYLWASFKIPSAPLGSYVWVAELRDPGTGELITTTGWEWKLSALVSMETPTLVLPILPNLNEHEWQPTARQLNHSRQRLNLM